jgi:hypothetical protein
LPEHSRDVHGQAEDSRQFAWLLTIVAGTAIGGLIAYFAVRWYEARQIERALAQLQLSVAETSARMQRDAAALAERVDATQAGERERVAAEAARKEEAKRLAAESEARLAAAAQLQAEQRDAAWQRYYRPSEECRNPDNRASMACANEHARAKRDFDSKWARGELRP